jgi:NitT/TauT family transport system substrate-binding protein
VTVALLPIEATAQAFYAKQEGFFRRQGLDVKITVIAEPTLIGAAVLSGDAQFGSVSVGALATLKTRSLPVRAVAAGSLHRPGAPTSALVAARGKKITRARDLVGKLIAIDTKNNLAHIALLKWLKRNGMSEKDVRLTEIQFPDMLGPLRRGQVDAAVIPEPFLTVARQRGSKRIAIVLDAVCTQDCLSTMWMARKDVDRDTTARFRNAIQAASVWANKKRNERASGVILAKYTGIDAAVIPKMTRVSFATRFRPRIAQPWIDAFAEFGVIPQSFSAVDLVR